MNLRLKRIEFNDEYTLGNLEVYENGCWKHLCDVIEDPVRKEKKTGTALDGRSKFAIPYGKYTITMLVPSPRFSNYKEFPFARKYRGIVPRLINIKHYDGIVIQPQKSGIVRGAVGGLIVGINDRPGHVADSISTFTRIMDDYFVPAKRNKEQITIEII